MSRDPRRFAARENTVGCSDEVLRLVLKNNLRDAKTNHGISSADELEITSVSVAQGL